MPAPNGGGYAAYENSGFDVEDTATGLDKAYDAFHNAVTDAYVACMDSGLVPTDSPTHDDTIVTLADMLGDAIHTYYLAASIDTIITVPAQTVAGSSQPSDDGGPMAEQTGVGKGHLE